MTDAGKAFIKALGNREGPHALVREKEELARVENCEDIPRLVVIDTLLLNADRFPPSGQSRPPNFDNVFLSEESSTKGKLKLLAMDFTHCLGGTAELTSKVNTIQNSKDERVYGLFPQWKESMKRREVDQAAERLSQLDRKIVESVLSKVPTAWDFGPRVREAVCGLVCDRASFLAGHVRSSGRFYRTTQERLDC